MGAAYTHPHPNLLADWGKLSLPLERNVGPRPFPLRLGPRRRAPARLSAEMTNLRGLGPFMPCVPRKST